MITKKKMFPLLRSCHLLSLQHSQFIPFRLRTTPATPMGPEFHCNDNDPRVRDENKSDKKCVDAQQDIADKTNLQIPSPLKLPILGNVRDFLGTFGSKAHTFLQSRAKEFGSIYEFSSLGQKMVFLFDYRDTASLRAAEGASPEHIEFKHLIRHRKEHNLPLGVLISTGDEWVHQRRLLSGFMLKPEIVFKYFDALKEVTHDSIRSTQVRVQDARQVDVERLTSKFALEGIGRVVLGKRLGCFRKDSPPYLDRFLHLVRRNVEDARQLLIIPDSLWNYIPAWKRHNQGWDYILNIARHHVDRQIESWTSAGSTPDDCVLGLLHSDGKMSRDELYVNTTDILLAAIDTTSSAIQWALYEISRHPEVQDDILREFAANQGTQPLSYKQLHSLKLLRAVLKETLRLHPVAFFTSRITQHEAKVAGYNIPPKTHVACSMYVMGRDDTVFHDPEKFLPERWLDWGLSMPKCHLDPECACALVGE